VEIDGLSVLENCYQFVYPISIQQIYNLFLKFELSC